MSLIYVVVFSLTFFAQTGYDHKTVDQASVYLDKISNEEELSESYWALNELYTNTCKLNGLVIRQIVNSREQKVKQYFSGSSCTDESGSTTSHYLERLRKISLDNGLLALGLYYVNKATTVEDKRSFYTEFESKWAQKYSPSDLKFFRDVITSKDLRVEQIPQKGKELIFYSFLYDGSFSSNFSETQDQALLSEWITSFDDNYTEKNLLYGLQVANIVRYAFEINAYPIIQQFLPEIKENPHFPISNERTRHYNATRYALTVIGRYDESLSVLRNHLLPLHEYLDSPANQEAALFAIGTNLYSLGKFQEAKEIFESFLNDPNSTINKSDLFNQISICYFKLGEKNKYINYQLNALEEAKKDTQYVRELTILNNLSFYYTQIRDSETALKYLDLAEEVAIRNKDDYQLGNIHRFSGSFYWEIYRDATTALTELDSAQQYFDPNIDYDDYTGSLETEAEILISLDSLDRANEIYVELKDLALEKTNSPHYLESLIGLTQIALKKNDFTEASTLLNEIKIYPSTDLDFNELIKLNTVKASYEKETGDLRAAYESFIPIIAQITDRARNSIDSQSGSWTIESEYIEAYNLAIEMLLELEHYAKAIQVLDDLKTINDAALYNSPILRAQRLTEEELAKDQLLNNQIQELRNQYLNTSSTTRRFQIDQEIELLSAQREQILNQIRTNISLKSSSIWSAQRKLEKNEMIIHFTEVGDHFYASFVSKDDIHVEVHPFDSDVKNQFRSTADDLASSNTNLNDLYRIYSFLNLDEHISDNISQLTVIPDNYLYRLPLGILPTIKPYSSTSYGSAKYLLEDFDIKYFTSLGEFIENTRKERTLGSIDFSGYAVSDFSAFESSDLPTLPFTTQEVRNINASLNRFSNRNIYLENEATKDSFIAGIQNSRIVHVATHSEVSEQDPLFSTVYLKDNDDSGEALYAYELFNARINSELIMLNSCSSGSGSYLQGSGVVGLSRALRYAGAKSLALNIWSVNDKSAAEFAVGFYESVDEGTPRWIAMRESKLHLLKTGNANPYYWGAYMLIGNPTPLTKKPANAGLLYSLLLLTILGATYTVRSRKLE
jgi:CHAT domain-containing protein